MIVGWHTQDLTRRWSSDVMQELTPKALIRSLPALSPSAFRLCNLCRGFPHAPFGVAYLFFVR
jgi:hypothetical protein